MRNSILIDAHPIQIAALQVRLRSSAHGQERPAPTGPIRHRGTGIQSIGSRETAARAGAVDGP